MDVLISILQCDNFLIVYVLPIAAHLVKTKISGPIPRAGFFHVISIFLVSRMLENVAAENYMAF